ncbi:hypothetical protein [Herbidospora yilanensis]|uniref:hypothetical protein n=1 Tax=Herbidospora yilanensis TaxID=354426 RepID=UPI000B035031|nr:hypothetical protein [Herbidospora yilanensis]
MTSVTVALPAVEEKTADPQVMKDVNDALMGISGFAEFSAATNGFLKGDIDVEQALEAMAPFLRGEICRDEADRERMIQLGQTIEAKCGWASVLATLTACTAAFSCSGFCC